MQPDGEFGFVPSAARVVATGFLLGVAAGFDGVGDGFAAGDDEIEKLLALGPGVETGGDGGDLRFDGGESVLLVAVEVQVGIVAGGWRGWTRAEGAQILHAAALSEEGFELACAEAAS